MFIHTPFLSHSVPWSKLLLQLLPWVMVKDILAISLNSLPKEGGASDHGTLDLVLYTRMKVGATSTG